MTEYEGGEHAAPTKPLLSDGVYDLFKNFVQVILPGIGTLYFALAAIWGLPRPDDVVGTIAAVTVFLGLFLKLSTRSYNNSDARFDGVVNIKNDEEEGTSLVHYHVERAALADKDEVSLKVNRL